MADDQIIVDIAIGNVDAFQKQVNEATKAIDAAFTNVGNKSEKVFADQIGGSLLDFGKSLGAVALAIGTVKKAIEIAFDGEKVKALNAQFDLLAQNAGTTGDVLKQSLLGAADGLIDGTDIIRSASKALIELGEQSARLPELLKLAKQATAVFGGEVLGNFEAINNAIASGNTRQLKSIGIIVDSDKAYRDYAKSIGVAASALNENGRQQALLNAVLDRSKTSFDGVDLGINKSQNSFKRLKVSISEASESFAILFSNATASSISAINVALTDLFSTLSDRLKTAAGINKLPVVEQAALLGRELDRVNERLDFINKNNLAAGLGGEINSLNFQAKKLRGELELINESQRKLSGAERAASQSGGLTAAQSVDPEKAAALVTQRNQILNGLEKERLNAIQATLATEEQFNQFTADRKLQIDQEFELKRQATIAQLKATGLTQAQAQADAEVSITAQKNEQIRLLEENANANLVKVRNIVQGGIINGLTNAFAGLGAALAKGKGGFEAFGKAVISALGAMAIQIGALLVQIGLGFAALGPVLPVFGLSGAQAVIAGLALIALGGALSAVGGGGGESIGPSGASGGGSGGGGGIAQTSPFGSPATQLGNVSAAQNGTVVNLNVAGNVLDRRETGLELAQVIQDHFNNNGQVIANGGGV